jgi:hypothetical protein
MRIHGRLVPCRRATKRRCHRRAFEDDQHAPPSLPPPARALLLRLLWFRSMGGPSTGFGGSRRRSAGFGGSASWGWRERAPAWSSTGATAFSHRIASAVAAASLVLLMLAAGRRVGRCAAAMDGRSPAATLTPPWTDGAARREGERAARRGESGVVAVSGSERVSGAERKEMFVGNSLGVFQKKV